MNGDAATGERGLASAARTATLAGQPQREDAPSSADALVRVGERFGRTMCWDADAIRRFADSVGDANPMHHDAGFAAASPAGALIASGTQTVSAMMGAFATWFTRRDDGVARLALGMDFRFRLRAPVRADEPLRIEWEVIARDWKPRLGGFVVTARGTAATPAGVALEAEGTGLVKPAHDAPQPQADPRTDPQTAPQIDPQAVAPPDRDVGAATERGARR